MNNQGNKYAMDETSPGLTEGGFTSPRGKEEGDEVKSMGEFSPYRGDLFSTRGQYERGIIYASRRGGRPGNKEMSTTDAGGQDSSTGRHDISTLQEQSTEKDTTVSGHFRSQTSDGSKQRDEESKHMEERFNSFECLQMSSTATLANASFEETERKKIASSGAAQTLFDTWKIASNPVLKRNCAITLANVFSSESMFDDDMLLPIISLPSIDPALYDLLRQLPSSVVRVKKDCQGQEVFAAAASALYKRLHEDENVDLLFLPGILAALMSIIRYKHSTRTTRLMCLQAISRTLHICKESEYENEAGVDEFVDDEYDEDSEGPFETSVHYSSVRQSQLKEEEDEDAKKYAAHKIGVDSGVVALITHMIEHPLMNEKNSGEDTSLHKKETKKICAQILANLVHAPNARQEINSRVIPALLDLVSQKNDDEEIRNIAVSVLYELAITGSKVAQDMLEVVASVEALTRASLRLSKLAAMSLGYWQEVGQHEDKLENFSAKYYVNTDPDPSYKMESELPQVNKDALRICSALLYMSRDDNLVDIILSCGAGDALKLWFDIATNLPDSSVIREMALLALANLFEKADSKNGNSQTLLRLGFTKIMVDVIVSPLAQDHGFEISEEALFFRESALKGSSIESRSPTRRCAKALSSLSSSDEDTIKLLLEEGIVSALCEIIESTSDEQSRKDSLRALSNLSHSSVAIPWIISSNESASVEEDRGKGFIVLIMKLIPRVRDIQELMDVTELICSLSHHRECHNAILGLRSEELLVNEKAIEGANEEPCLLFQDSRILQLRICQYYHPEKYCEETVDGQYPLSNSTPTGSIEGLLGVDNGRFVSPIELLCRIAILDTPIKQRCMGSLCQLTVNGKAQEPLIRYGFLDLLAFYARAVESSLRRECAKSAYCFTCVADEPAVPVDSEARQCLSKELSALVKKYHDISQCPYEEIISSAHRAVKSHRQQTHERYNSRDIQLVLCGVSSALTIGALFRSDDPTTKCLCAAALHNLAFEESARQYLIEEGTLWACVRLALEAEIQAQEMAADEEERIAKEFGLIDEHEQEEEEDAWLSSNVDGHEVFRDWEFDESDKPVAGQGRGGKTSRVQLFERQANWQQTKESQKIAIARQRSSTQSPPSPTAMTGFSPPGRASKTFFDFSIDEEGFQEDEPKGGRTQNIGVSHEGEGENVDVSLLNSPMVRAQRLGSRGRFFSTDRVSIGGDDIQGIVSNVSNSGNTEPMSVSVPEIGNEQQSKNPKVVVDENGTRILCLPAPKYYLLDSQLTATRLLRNMMFDVVKSSDSTQSFYEIVAEKRSIDALVTFASSQHPIVKLDTSVVVANLSLAKQMREHVVSRGLLAAVWENLEVADLPVALRSSVTLLRLCSHDAALDTICSTGNNLVPLLDRFIQYCDRVCREWNQDVVKGGGSKKLAFIKRHIGAHGGIGSGPWEGFEEYGYFEGTPVRKFTGQIDKIREMGSDLAEEKPSVNPGDIRCEKHLRNLFSRVILCLSGVMKRLGLVPEAHEMLIGQGIMSIGLRILKLTRKARQHGLFAESILLSGWAFSSSEHNNNCSVVHEQIDPYSRVITHMVKSLDKLMMVPKEQEEDNHKQVYRKIAHVISSECLGLDESGDVKEVSLNSSTQAGILPYVLRIFANITGTKETAQLLMSSSTLEILSELFSSSDAPNEDRKEMSSSQMLSMQQTSAKILANLIFCVDDPDNISPAMLMTLATKFHEYSQFWVCQINQFPIQSSLNLQDVFYGDLESTKEFVSNSNVCVAHGSCGPLLMSLAYLILQEDDAQISYYSRLRSPAEDGESSAPDVSKFSEQIMLKMLETPLLKSIAEMSSMTCVLLPRLEVLLFESKEFLKGALLQKAGFSRGAMRETRVSKPNKLQGPTDDIQLFDLAQGLIKGDISDETLQKLNCLIAEEEVRDTWEAIVDELASERPEVLPNIDEDDFFDSLQSTVLGAVYYRKAFHFMRRVQLVTSMLLLQFTRTDSLAEKLITLDKQNTATENQDNSELCVSIISTLAALARWGRPLISCTATEAISNLSLTPENREYLLGKNIVPTLASLASQSAYDQHTKQWCARTLQLMALDASLQDSLINDSKLVRSVLLLNADDTEEYESPGDYANTDYQHSFDADDQILDSLRERKGWSVKRMFLSEDDHNLRMESYLQALIMNEQSFCLGGVCDVLLPPFLVGEPSRNEDDIESLNSSGLFVVNQAEDVTVESTFWDPDRLANWTKLKGFKVGEYSTGQIPSDANEEQVTERDSTNEGSQSPSTPESVINHSSRHEVRGLTKPFLMKDQDESSKNGPKVVERRRYSMEDIAVIKKTDVTMAHALEAAGTVSSDHVVRASNRLGLSNLVLNSSKHKNPDLFSKVSNDQFGQMEDFALIKASRRKSDDIQILQIPANRSSDLDPYDTVNVLDNIDERRTEYSSRMGTPSTRIKPRQPSQSFRQGVALDRSQSASKKREHLASRSYQRKYSANVDVDREDDIAKASVYSRMVSDSRAWAEDRNTDREVQRQAMLIPLRREKEMLESIQANLRFTGSAKSGKQPITRRSLPKNLRNYLEDQRRVTRPPDKSSKAKKPHRNVQSAVALRKSRVSSAALQRSASAFQNARAGTGRSSVRMSSRSRSSSKKSTSRKRSSTQENIQSSSTNAKRDAASQENSRTQPSVEINASGFDDSSFLTSGNADSDPQQ